MPILRIFLIIIKIISALIIFVLLCAAIYAYWFNKQGSAKFFPYPYQFSTPIKSEELNNPHILLVGDIQAEKFDPYFKLIKSSIEVETGYPLNFFNKGINHSLLYRTLLYVKSLKNLPPIIIYFGGYEEFYENRVPLDQLTEVEYNFNQFKNPIIKNALFFYPKLSSYIYHPHKLVQINSDPTQIKEHPENFYDEIKQREMILVYQMYEQELTELIEYIHSKNKKLLILTPPLNTKLPPLKVCSNTTTFEIEEEQKTVEDLIQKSRIKEAQNKIENLLELTPGNARSTYLMAQIYELNHNKQNAQRYYEMSSALDCSMKRPNYIFNQIMLNQSNKYEVPIIDFHHELKDEFTLDGFPSENDYKALQTKIKNFIKIELKGL